MSQQKYITLTAEEKSVLNRYISEKWGENRISQGAAIAHLAKERLSGEEVEA
jgi:hypothetical protein